MNQEQENVASFTPQMVEFIDDLMSKSKVVFARTEGYKNCSLVVHGVSVPIRVDDNQLLFIGSVLLPNIMNYLVNILPQFLYPYVVAYLQDLSEMRTDPLTITELFNYLTENYGNIQFSAQTESEEVGL